MESCLKIGKAKGDVQVTFWTLDDVMMCWCCFLGWEIWKMSGMYCLWWIDSDNHSEAKYRFTMVYKCRDAVDGMDLCEERVNFTPLHNSYLGNPRNPISLLPNPNQMKQCHPDCDKAALVVSFSAQLQMAGPSLPEANQRLAFGWERMQGMPGFLILCTGAKKKSLR